MEAARSLRLVFGFIAITGKLAKTWTVVKFGLTIEYKHSYQQLTKYCLQVDNYKHVECAKSWGYVRQN